MRYRLRTLLIVMALGTPVIALGCWRIFMAGEPLAHPVWINILLVVAIAIALPNWFLAIYFEFKALRHLKPGIRLWADAPFGNPFNHLLTSNLDEKGTRARRNALLAWIGFVVPILILLAIAALTGNLDH